MSFSFSLFARQREGKERKERENMLPLPTLLRAFNQMDVASRACTLSLAKNARGANVDHLFSREKIVKFFIKSHSAFSLQLSDLFDGCDNFSNQN